MKTSKVDWLNHLIAFVSALLGIFIAFQLDDWQERRSQQEKVRISLEAIRKEIDGNLEIYKSNIDSLSPFMDHIEFAMEHRSSDGLRATDREVRTLELKHGKKLKI